jgi:proteasome lid subunit RPN8/RPN11
MLRHAKSAVPMEAVGIIGGDSSDGLAHLIIELPNLADRNEFFADPFAQYQAEQQISEAGLNIIAIYHSHPGGGTALSESDRNAAINWDCAHIVIVPERDSEEDNHIRAYRVLEEGKAIEIVVVQN